MNSFVQFSLTVLAYAIPILLAIMLREVLHAYVARQFGDNGPAAAGRLSLNPLKHIDPFGTVLLPLLLLWAGLMPFGYPKAYPPGTVRVAEVYPHMTVIALSGPLGNFIMGLAWVAFLFVLMLTGSDSEFLVKMGQVGMGVNAAMIVFNLLPIPPFDGGRAIAGQLPLALAQRFVQIERYSLFMVIGLLVLLQLGIFKGAFSGAINAVISLFVLLVKPFFPL